MTLSCLTDRYGKIKGLVKGLRAQPNRHRSAMEPLTINRIVFYDTRTSQLHLIAQCELLESLAGLQRDLDIMQLAACCANLIETIVPLEEPQPATYRLFRHTLERLAVSPGDLAGVRVHFIVRLLRLAGFQPRLDACTACDGSLRAGGHWSSRQGGLLCPKCLHEDPKAERISPEVLAALLELSDATHPMPLDRSLTQLLSRRLDEFLRWRLDRPIKMLTT